MYGVKHIRPCYGDISTNDRGTKSIESHSNDCFIKRFMSVILKSTCYGNQFNNGVCNYARKSTNKETALTTHGYEAHRSHYNDRCINDIFGLCTVVPIIMILL